MLQIKTPKGYLDLADISISLVLKNPMFNEADGSYSYNFSLPATDNNRKIFSFPHRIVRNSNNSLEVECEILFNGMQIISGIMLVIEASNENYECSLGVGKGVFNYDIKDKLMSEVNMGEDIPSHWDPENAYYNDVVTKFYPDVKFAIFPIKNDNYIDPVYYPFLFNDHLYNYMNYYWAWPDYPTDSGFRNDITPFPYIAYFIDCLFKSFGKININNPFAEHPELRKLVIFNVHSKALVAPQELNDVINLSEHLPKIKISNLLDGLKTLFGLNIFLNSTGEATLKFIKDIIKSTDIINFSNNIIINPILKFDSNITRFKFLMNFDSKDAWATDNIKSIQEYNYKGAVYNIIDLPLINNKGNDIYKVLPEFSFYVWRYNDNDMIMKWEYLCNEFLPDYYTGSGDKDKTLETDISSLGMHLGVDESTFGQTNFPTRIFVTPITNQSGWFENFAGSFENTCAGRLLFYRGMQVDSNGSLYPLGSSDVYNMYREKISDANLSLRWDTEYGLYENFWKDYIYWQLNIAKFVQFKKAMSVKELRDIDFSRKYRINDQNYLLKEIRVTLSANSISVAEIDAYTCP